MRTIIVEKISEKERNVLFLPQEEFIDFVFKNFEDFKNKRQFTYSDKMLPFTISNKRMLEYYNNFFRREFRRDVNLGINILHPVVQPQEFLLKILTDKEKSLLLEYFENNKNHLSSFRIEHFNNQNYLGMYSQNCPNGAKFTINSYYPKEKFISIEPYDEYAVWNNGILSFS